MSDIATTYRITNDENNRYIRNDNGNKVHQYISEHTTLSEQNTYALLQEISGLEVQDIYIYFHIFFIRYMKEIRSANPQQMNYTTQQTNKYTSKNAFNHMIFSPTWFGRFCHHQRVIQEYKQHKNCKLKLPDVIANILRVNYNIRWF
jgi:hypothetical protein